MPSRRRATALVCVSVGLPLVVFACVDPPPKIASIPPSGLALRVHVFGADAQEAKQYFVQAKANNKGFSVVSEGGDGEVVVGLEHDSPKCVQPTSLCSYRISFRVKNAAGAVKLLTTTQVAASSDRCTDLCSKALVNVATKVIDLAAGALASSAPAPAEEAGVDTEDGSAGDAGPPDAEPTAPTPPTKPGGKKKPPAKPEPPKPEPARPDPVMCAVGQGGRLPTDEAERRAAQVEALKRLNVLEQAEYDCLRKAYLNRL